MKRTMIIATVLLAGLVLDSFGARVLNSRRLLDQYQGLWLGECLANWTGLQTECELCDPPFYTGEDADGLPFVFQDPWGADDDTDVEYVFLYLMDKYSPKLTADQLMEGYTRHIVNEIWNATLSVHQYALQGVPLPFSAIFNEKPLYISDQLKTEIFGAVSPGMVYRAMDIAGLTITTRSFAAHASQFYHTMFAAAATIDTNLSYAAQVESLVVIARKIIPDGSKSADIIDFVYADFRDNPDKTDWESTRDKIYIRYQRDAAQRGWEYVDCTESSVNLAAGVLCALYGQGDYTLTLQIGALAGWDSDNQPATLCALLGYLYGYEKLYAYLKAQFPGRNISLTYNARRTRSNLPDYLPDNSEADDSLPFIAQRHLRVAERNIVAAGGSIDSTTTAGIRLYTLPDDSLVNPLARRWEQSLNNLIRIAGGTITASGLGASDIPQIADGCENEWSGETEEAQRCFTGTLSYHTSSQETKTEDWYSVTYDRDVSMQGVMIYTGPVTESGYFSSLSVEIQQSGTWIAVTDPIYVQPLESDKGWQVVHMKFAPVVGNGLKIRGPVAGTNSSTTLTELDPMGSLQTSTAFAPPEARACAKGAGKFAKPHTIFYPARARALQAFTSPVFDIRGRLLSAQKGRMQGHEVVISKAGD